MWKKINELKYRLVFKYTVFFVVGIFLPLVLILSYNLADFSSRNIAETEDNAYNTVLSVEKSFRNELSYRDNFFEAIAKDELITEFPFRYTDGNFRNEARSFVDDYTVEDTSLYDSLTFYYYDIEESGEDSVFLNTSRVSNTKWYKDFFAQSGYTNWHVGATNDYMYKMTRLYNGGSEIGVAVATVDIQRIIDMVAADVTTSGKIFAFVSYGADNYFTSGDGDAELISELINDAGFSRNEKFDSDYRISHKGDMVIAVNRVPQFGIMVGCYLDTVSQKAYAPSYIFILLIFIVFLGATAVFYYFILRIFRKLNKDIELMEGYIENDFTGRIPINGEDEISDIEKQFNRMLDRMDILKKNIILKEQSQKHAELTALQNQTNPHFIYNTLNTFRMKLVINGDMQTAEEIAKFGKLLRYNMTTRDHMTTLEEEMTYLKYYLDLQNDRFSEKIFYDYEIPIGYGDVKIPRFIFQPMAENALKYGKKSGAPLKITVSFETINDEHLLVSFMDNGRGCDERTVTSLNSQFVDRKYIHRPQTENSSQIGLKNINERLILIYGEDYHLNVSSEENMFFEIGFKIPIEK